MNEETRALVQQVVDFAESGGLLKGQLAFEAPDVVVVTDLEEAVERARVQFKFKDDGERDLDHADWSGLREDRIADVYAATFEQEDKREREEAARPYEKAGYKAAYATLGDPWEEIAEDVAADMELIIRARALVGTESPFFERLFALYQEGVWPCGWSGEYPDGVFRVYNPHP